MNKKTLLIIGLVICLVLAGIIGIMVHNRAAEESEDEFMSEEQTMEEMTQEPEDEDVDLIDLSEMDPDEDALAATLEEALPALTEAGYHKTPDGYKATDNVDGVRSIRIINAKGNEVTADLTYDYGQDNEEMIKFFKADDDDAVSRMLAAYLVVLGDRSTATDGKMKYKVTVGGVKVASGTMTLSEARKLQAVDPGE